MILGDDLWYWVEDEGGKKKVLDRKSTFSFFVYLEKQKVT